MTMELNLLDLVSIHHRSLLSCLPDPSGEEAARLSATAQNFLQESLAPYELAHRGFSEANARLRELNASLEQRVSDRTRELRTIAQRFEALNEFARAVSGSLDLDSVFGIILRQVAALTSCHWCSIAQYDEAESIFRPVAEWLSELDRVAPDDRRLTIDESASGVVMRRNGPFIVQDTRLTPQASLQRLAREGVLSLTSVPVYTSGNLWGTLTVGFHETNQITPDRVEFVRAIAAHLAVAIRNAELHTRLQSAYEELQHSHQQIIQQERLGALGQMASGIAHDFNNALSPILGFSELLLARPEDRQDQNKLLLYLNLMHSAAGDAAMVVARLKDFYRAREAGEVMMPVDLNQVVEQVISLTQPRWKDQAQAQGRTVRIETQLQPVSEIAGNQAELREMLTNLIFNAVDAMPNGGEICLRTHVAERQVVLEVTDTGTGMTEEVQQRCLEPFFTTKGEQGTGLGLGMVYGIVQRHEGLLDLESKPGEGTSFILRFPILYQRMADNAAGESLTRARPLHVLVVDDEPMVREFVAEGLRSDGHTVEMARNGREGLDCFERSQFDLVVTDRGMPEMNGDQLATEIKRVSPQTPIILLTGFGDLMSATQERPAHVDAVVGKPVRVTELWRAVAELASGPSASAEPAA
jgi:signal transduction histidine kinase/CheY-like chemotaxis protein